MVTGKKSTKNRVETTARNMLKPISAYSLKEELFDTISLADEMKCCGHILSDSNSLFGIVLTNFILI
jgi:hypothetical protein